MVGGSICLNSKRDSTDYGLPEALILSYGEKMLVIRLGSERADQMELLGVLPGGNLQLRKDVLVSISMLQGALSCLSPSSAGSAIKNKTWISSFKNTGYRTLRDATLNASQRNATEAILSPHSSRIVLIQGPPGE